MGLRGLFPLSQAQDETMILQSPDLTPVIFGPGTAMALASQGSTSPSMWYHGTTGAGSVPFKLLPTKNRHCRQKTRVELNNCGERAN